MKIYLKTLWWAILGRPIISKIHFTEGFHIDGKTKNLLIIGCQVGKGKGIR